MPLLKIETRPKEESTSPAPRPPRPPARRPGAKESTSAAPALLAGALFALLVVVGATAFLLYRNGRLGALSPASGGADAQGGAVTGQTGASGSAAGSGAVGAAGGAGVVPVAPTGPLNADYPRDATVAIVNNEPIQMADLESAVRIAHTLGSFTNDKLPDYTDAAGMKEFQIRMLRRQVDTILMRQAYGREGVQDPGGTADQLIDGFLQKVGADRQKLDSVAQANGVSPAELTLWFEESRKVNLYVQSKVLLNPNDAADQVKRDAAVKDWLTRAWQTNQIEINFYDPTQLLQPAAPAQSGEVAPTQVITP